MESESSKDTTAAPRKMRFVPKAPPRRAPKPEVKPEVDEDIDANQAKELLRRFNEGAMRAKSKVEKKVSPSQIAFGIGGASPSIKSYGVPKAGSSYDSHQRPGFKSDNSVSGLREKEYREPWDYYSYYPVTLPMRRPYSGNPEILNEEEFMDDPETITYDENWSVFLHKNVTCKFIAPFAEILNEEEFMDDPETITYNENSVSPAMELGLMEENLEPSMFFLQLPPIMPMIKRSATADGREVTDSSRLPGDVHVIKKACSFNELPAGFMGKMLVYRSGAIKLKIGDTLYDVSPGMDCVSAQDVVAINTAEKHCCVVGELNKHATVTPDVDSILNSMADL